MIDGHSVLGVILARGGSKGLPRKNVRELVGKPLIAWTIEAGQESEHIDRLILSSDDQEIIRVAEEYGCEVPFHRPSRLAEDDTSSFDALLHALSQVESHHYTVLLQPTSPLRIVEDIDGTIERCHESDAPSCVTVTKTEKPPEWMYILREDHGLVPVVEQGEKASRRQEVQDVYVLNGAVYVAVTAHLKNKRRFICDNTKGYPMPQVRSPDVDKMIDLKWCEFLLRSAGEENL